MRIELTDGQAVTIHGWWRARNWLVWTDVSCKPNITLPILLSYGLSEQALYQLQPDLKAWIIAGKVELKDCPRLRPWDAHPVKDFKADLADIIRMAWSPETMTRCGIYYDDLVQLGLTPETMQLFNFTLINWASIGFTKAHAERVPPRILFRLFDMTVPQVLCALPTLAKDIRIPDAQAAPRGLS